MTQGNSIHRVASVGIGKLLTSGPETLESNLGIPTTNLFEQLLLSCDFFGSLWVDERVRHELHIYLDIGNVSLKSQLPCNCSLHVGGGFSEQIQSLIESEELNCFTLAHSTAFTGDLRCLTSRFCHSLTDSSKSR